MRPAATSGAAPETPPIGSNHVARTATDDLLDNSGFDGGSQDGQRVRLNSDVYFG